MRKILAQSTATYYWLSSLFTTARMGIGATSVVYMLQNGCSLSDIAIIKIIQGLVIFFSEIPTGLIADTLGRRASLFLSAISAGISFAIFLMGNHVGYFMVAEIFNALAISFWSGAFEALAVENLKAEKRSDNFLEFFFARTATYSAAATMLGGLAGGILGDVDIGYPFIFSIFLMGVTTVLINYFTEEPQRLVEKKVNTLSLKARTVKVLKQMAVHQKNAFIFATSNQAIKSFFLIQILIQFALQPVFHYWQPYFKNLSSTINTTELGIIFFLYVGSQLVFSGISSVLFKYKKVSIAGFNSLMAVLTILTFFVMGSSYSMVLSVFAFVLMQGAVNSFRNTIGATFNRFIENEQRATVLSSVSFISRAGMIVHLLILKYTSELFPLHYSFLLSGVSCLILIPYLYKWNLAEPKEQYA